VLLVFALGVAGVVLLAWRDVFTSSPALRGSGIAASQRRQVPRFAGVELAGSNTVVLRVGDRQSVVVHADDNLLGRVTTEVRDGRLVIGNTPGSFTTKAPMRVEIRVPSIGLLALSGSGAVVATGIRGPALKVTLTGSGTLRASGTVDRLDATLTGSGDVELLQLVAADAHAVVSGSGRILVTATRRLDASVLGSGTILYGGKPARLTTSVTGSGVIDHT